MKVSRENKPVKTLISKLKRNNIILKHKLQRRESVWSNANKALLFIIIVWDIFYAIIKYYKKNKKCSVKISYD